MPRSPRVQNSGPNLRSSFATRPAEVRRLGLFGIENATTRTLQRTGTRVTVSLDRVLLRDLLKREKPGTKVKVGRHGDHIAIQAE